MAKSKITRIGALAAGFVMVGLIGFGVGGFAGGHGFGGAGMHLLLSGLIDDLNLNDGQQQRVDAVHEIIQDHIEGAREGKETHHQRMVEILEGDIVDQAEVKENIDQHLEQARSFAYEISDELVPLVNSLDEEQRTTLKQFAEKAHGAMEGHGCGGPHGLMKRGGHEH